MSSKQAIIKMSTQNNVHSIYDKQKHIDKLSLIAFYYKSEIKLNNCLGQ